MDESRRGCIWWAPQLFEWSEQGTTAVRAGQVHSGNRFVGVWAGCVSVPCGMLACQNVMLTHITAIDNAATREKTSQHIFLGGGWNQKSQKSIQSGVGSSQKIFYRFLPFSSPCTSWEGDKHSAHVTSAPTGRGLQKPTAYIWNFISGPHFYLLAFFMSVYAGKQEVMSCNSRIFWPHAASVRSHCGVSEITTVTFLGRKLTHQYLQNC